MYTKLANSILTSTVWMESDQTRIVWFTLLAMADKNGEVQASVPGLANIARVPVDACREALEIFQSPDPDSRTKDDDGRRIEEIRGGWHILNHEYYRDMGSDEDRRKKAAERQRRYRESKKRNASVTGVTSRYKSRQFSHTKADTNTKADTEEEKEDPPLPPEGGGTKRKPDYQPILGKWKQHCVALGLPEPMVVSGKRETRLRACAGDPKWMAVLDEALEALISNPFNLGDNDRGWKADIDYLIRPGKAFELVEKHRASATPPPQKPETLEGESEQGRRARLEFEAKMNAQKGTTK